MVQPLSSRYLQIGLMEFRIDPDGKVNLIIVPASADDDIGPTFVVHEEPLALIRNGSTGTNIAGSENIVTLETSAVGMSTRLLSLPRVSGGRTTLH
jgi:hypothetical protein